MKHLWTWTFWLAACGVEAPSSDPLDALPTSSTPLPMYRATIQREADAPIASDARSIYIQTVVGDGCSPAVTLDVYSYLEENPGGAVNTRLMFGEPLGEGVTSPLPDAATWNLNNRASENPLKIDHVSDDALNWNLFGGQVRIVAMEPARWELAFEGESLVTCDGWRENCVPITGASLVLEPLDSGATMPEPREECLGGVPYPWPDSSDGCGVLESPPPITECPTPPPW